MTAIRLGLCLLLASTAFWSSAAEQDEPAERAPSGRISDFVKALRKGDTNAAFALLDNLPEDEPSSLRILTRAGEILADAGWPTRALPYVQRAYDKDSNDMEVVHGYIRVQLLARTNLSEPLVSRPAPKSIPAEHRFITDAPKFPDDSAPLSHRRVIADLAFLEIVLGNAYSYADRRGIDWRLALDSLRASMPDATPANTFALRLRRFFTIFGDPHTAVRAAPSGFFPAGAAPFVALPDGERVIALQPGRKGFLNATCRYLAAIDDVEIAEWLRVAAFDVPKASPQWQRRQTVAALGQIAYLRTELGLPPSTNVNLQLVSRDGREKRKLTLPLATKPASGRHWPAGQTRRIEEELGYLRIESMDTKQEFLAGLDKTMADFRNTRGLIIDVRENSGGSQDAVRRILPYFLEPHAPMRIFNVAAYRLPVKLPHPCTEGYLGLYGRGLFPVTAREWSDPERQQIAGFLKSFVPSWKLPPGKFSDWHVMGIAAESNPNAYRYTNRVVVLMNEECFSATDNFLGALQGLPNVTLLGTTSGGGSGRMATYVLPNSHLPLTICQMASFRANGDLYDGQGVKPDVVMEPAAEDLLSSGNDSVLSAAIKRLKNNER